MRWIAAFMLALAIAARVASGEQQQGCGCAAGTNRASAMRNLAQSQVATPDENSEASCVAGDVEIEARSAADEDMVLLPGGVFTMGTDSPKIPSDGESPARKVRVSPFLLHRLEVSVADFERFVRATGHVTEAESFGWSFCFIKTLSAATLATVDKQVDSVPWWVPVAGADWAHPNGPDSAAAADGPVTHVSHNDARAYCVWAGLRLPREAEFEFAMRGGLENTSYPWGEELTPGGAHRANLWQGVFPETNLVQDGFAWTAPVTAFGPQNAFGLHNIVGNVWEWVADAWVADHARYVPADGAALVDPQVELHGQLESRTVERVKRGGSYMCHESYCFRYRTASRSHNSADSSAQNLGFRCAGDPAE